MFRDCPQGLVDGLVLGEIDFCNKSWIMEGRRILKSSQSEQVRGAEVEGRKLSIFGDSLLVILFLELLSTVVEVESR